MTNPDPVVQQLALLLRVADLAGRMAPSEDDGARATTALLHLIRRAADAERASLFEIENADADAVEPLAVVRIGRDVGTEDGVRAEAPFHPGHVALLLASVQSGTLEALGPLSDEDFHVHHRHEEPTVTRHAAFAPILVNGVPRGVLEVARSDDRPFDARDLAAVESGTRVVAAAVWGARREATIQSFLAALLPDVLQPARAGTTLPARVRAWLTTRRMEPAERRSIALATTIAELVEASPAALELVHTVLAAARKAFVRDVAAWSEVGRAR